MWVVMILSRFCGGKIRGFVRVIVFPCARGYGDIMRLRGWFFDMNVSIE
jgi:hypothetical protein